MESLPTGHAAVVKPRSPPSISCSLFTYYLSVLGPSCAHKIFCCGPWSSLGFLCGSVVNNLPANVGDSGSIPGTERSSGGGNSSPL